MICQKCGFGYMIDDSFHDIRALKCWVCGNRVYPDHPKRSGALVCSRCGSAMEEENALNLCKDCMCLLDIRAHHLKARTYGESVCACGIRYTRTSPTQQFHSKECRKRFLTVPAERKREIAVLAHDEKDGEERIHSSIVTSDRGRYFRWNSMTTKVTVGIHMREVNMVLYVQYHDDHYDFVDGQALDRLLARKEVRKFYRPSEERWIDVEHDPIRGSGGDYAGPERRQGNIKLSLLS